MSRRPKSPVVIVLDRNGKPPRHRRTNAEITADAAKAELDALVEEGIEAAKVQLAAASPAKKWVARKLIRRALRTGAGIRRS